MRRIIIIGIIVVAAVLAATIYFVYDPTVENNIFPRCVFYSLTGYQCAGCGSQRAIHCLLHGDIAGAWHYNAGLFFALPAVLLYGFAEFRRKTHPRFYVALTSTWVVNTIVGLIIAWWILRNIF